MLENHECSAKGNIGRSTNAKSREIMTKKTFLIRSILWEVATSGLGWKFCRLGGGRWAKQRQLMYEDDRIEDGTHGDENKEVDVVVWSGKKIDEMYCNLNEFQPKPLANWFPCHLTMAYNPAASILDYLEGFGFCAVWGPIFQWTLSNEEIAWVHNLLQIREVYLPQYEEDCRVWTCQSLLSFVWAYSKIVMTPGCQTLYLMWTIGTPPNVIFFSWAAIQDRILTMEHLWIDKWDSCQCVPFVL